MNFYYTFKNPQKGKVFAEIKPSVIKELPIKNDTFFEDQIINIVDKIIKIKQNDSNTDTSKLEKEIDDLIVQIEISLDEKKENQK